MQCKKKVLKILKKNYEKYAINILSIKYKKTITKTHKSVSIHNFYIQINEMCYDTTRIY